jgi:transposase
VQQTTPAIEETTVTESSNGSYEPTISRMPIRVWTQDESRFGLMSIIRRRLTLRGVKPLAPYQHEFANTYVYGAVEPITGESFWLELPRLDSQLFQIFLDHFSLAYPDSLNLIVLDNGSFHTTRKLNLPNNIRLIFTPPYTPEVNPIERVWLDLKTQLAGLVHSSLDGLSETIASAIQSYSPTKLQSLTSYPFFTQAVNALCSA